MELIVSGNKISIVSGIHNFVVLMQFWKILIAI